MKIKRSWMLFALITTITWGIWGAFIEIPEKNGFPPTLGYIAWAATMIPCALVALYLSGQPLARDFRSILPSLFIGLSGAGGQLLLFQALREGPAYLIFPIVSLYPILTIILSIVLLRERASRRQYFGIGLALPAILLLSWGSGNSSGNGNWLWLILAGLVFLCWGFQAFVMKFTNERTSAESIFFYMMVTAVAMAPVAWWMTDFDAQINWGWNGGLLAVPIHLLNSIGALTLVYALRYGKAIIVVPLTGLSPVITILLSLALYSVWPSPTLGVGIVLASVALYLFSE